MYRMKVHLFRVASSAGCANFGLRKMAKDHKKDYSQVAVNFYHEHLLCG